MAETRTRYENHPVARYADRVQLIYERRGEGDPWIEARVKLAGKWSAVFSLRTTSRDEALMNAVEELNRREGLHAAGKPQPARGRSAPKPVERTFGEVAEEVLNELVEERDELARRLGKASGKANTLATHISTVKTKLIPAFGDVPVPALT